MYEVNIEDLIFQARNLTKSFFFQALFLAIVIDIITGYAKAYKTKSFDSKIGTNGMIRHLIVLLLQTIVGLYARVLGYPYVSISVAVYFLSTYSMSILENLDVLGIPFPEELKEFFAQMRKRKIKIKEADITIEAKDMNKIH